MPRINATKLMASALDEINERLRSTEHVAHLFKYQRLHAIQVCLRAESAPDTFILLYPNAEKPVLFNVVLVNHFTSRDFNATTDMVVRAAAVRLPDIIDALIKEHGR